MLQHEFDFALQAVRTAADICRAVQAGICLESLEKKDRTPVTVADFAVQALVSSLLEEHFPDDPLVGEEGAEQLREAGSAELRDKVVAQVRAVRGDQTSTETILNWIDRGDAAGGASGRFWVLDPIDGTKGFLRNEQYAIALALIEEGQVVLGILGCPNMPASFDGTQDNTGYVFAAVRGEGAQSAPITERVSAADLQQIKVSTSGDPATARRCESVESAHASHDQMSRIAEMAHMTAAPIRLDSQAKYALVARGEAALYLRLSPDDTYQEKIWDHAAGALIVQEAGGIVTDLWGKPLDFSQGRELVNNRGVIAGNTALHALVVAATGEVLG